MNPWRFKSTADLADELPAQLDLLQARLTDFPPDQQDAISETVDQLRELQPLDAVTHSGIELVTTALETLGRISVKHGQLDEGVSALYSAHELSRQGKVVANPTRTMRSCVSTACEAIIRKGVADLVQGSPSEPGGAGAVLSSALELVNSAWGVVPPQLALSMNESLLTELEGTRAAHEEDEAFHQRFIRDNIDIVLEIDLPARLESVRERWIDLAEHVAPAAVKIARRLVRRPQGLSDLLARPVWDRIESALGRGDAESLATALEDAEDKLEENLRLRLDARSEYMRPVSDLKFRGNADSFFVDARTLLQKDDKRAIAAFRDIYYKKPTAVTAKEWYAYALCHFGKQTDVYDVIELLQDAIGSPHFNTGYNWPSYWNLACALNSVRARADEALGAMLPLLDCDVHPAEALDLCILWALDQHRFDLQRDLFLQSRYFEAYLLAALHDARSSLKEGKLQVEIAHLRRINRILQDRDRLIPAPAERLYPQALDAQRQEFSSLALEAAGIEWFRQRLSYGGEKRSYKNWECLAQLHDDIGDPVAAWRCYQEAWRLTSNIPKLPPAKKKISLLRLLDWAQRHDYREDALAQLRRSWQKTSLTQAEELVWEERLRIDGETAPPPPPSPPMNPQEVIERLAGGFERTSSVQSLADRAGDASSLVQAVTWKGRVSSPEATRSISAIISLAAEFQRGVSPERGKALDLEMREQGLALRQELPTIPFELAGLGRACERVVQSVGVRVRGLPDLTLTMPADLRLVLDKPSQAESLSTHVAVRIHNPAPESARDVRVAFSTASPTFAISEPEVLVTEVPPNADIVVDAAVELMASEERAVDVRIHVTYEMAGVQRTCHAGGVVPVESLGAEIPVTERFIVNAPVAADRTDVFHGRERELRDLQAAFAGGKLRRLYFVNGIRRVGKSSLMSHLARVTQPEIITLLIDFDVPQKQTEVRLVREMARKAIDSLTGVPGFDSLDLELPGTADFELDPPWIVFESFLRKIQRQSGRQVLVCLDELQVLVDRIANPDEPIDDSVLSWLREKVQRESDLLFVCTGSESYESVRDRYFHRLWGNITPYNVSFVDQTAMNRIVETPLARDGVTWLPEALTELWDLTEGHPWVTQILADKVAHALNREGRRCIFPGDVDRAANDALGDSGISGLWWNEDEGLVTDTHCQVVFLIIQGQTKPRAGISEGELARVCQKSGIRTVGKFIDEMRMLELITEEGTATESTWRIRGGFLERHLTRLMQRAVSQPTEPVGSGSTQPLALMLDVENVKITLWKVLEGLPRRDADALRERLRGDELATRLLEAAGQHGVPRQRWAVGNWDVGILVGDQMRYRNARFSTEMAGEQKADASDHVLKEKIHAVLRDHPEIGTFVIATGDGDYRELITTLQDHGKSVILWGCKKATSGAFGVSLQGPDRITIEWLEDLVFREAAASLPAT